MKYLQNCFLQVDVVYDDNKISDYSALWTAICTGLAVEKTVKDIRVVSFADTSVKWDEDVSSLLVRDQYEELYCKLSEKKTIASRWYTWNRQILFCTMVDIPHRERVTYPTTTDSYFYISIAKW